MIGPTSRKNWLTFYADPVPSALRNWSFYEIYLHFSYSRRPIFTTLGKMTDADK